MTWRLCIEADAGAIKGASAGPVFSGAQW